MVTACLAERTTLIQFGADAAVSVMPHADWTNLIRHPTFTEFVDPDGDASHRGIVEVPTIPEGAWAYYGVQGTTPIHFRQGHKIVATFYNRTAEYALLIARVSFVDPDAPDPEDSSRPWVTLQNRRYRDNADWMPPYETVEMEFYLAEAGRGNAIDGPASVGDFILINISKPYNDTHFVLSRIELDDAADDCPPGAPRDLAAVATSMTRDVAANSVRLAWHPAEDCATNATGISRYLIYRDGVLYDLVDEETTASLGQDLYYIDLNVIPGQTYRYSVSALDRAPNGTYPVPGRTDYRVGNEGALAGPVTIRLGAWQSNTLLDPHNQLEYLGAFRLPTDPNDRWSYCSEAMTYYPSGHPDQDPATELAGSIYLYTHLAQEIAEISIPVPVMSTNLADLPRASLLKGPTNLWPVIYTFDGNPSSIPPGGAEYRVAGLAYHPAANGVPERLYYGHCNYYASDGSAPSHGWFDLALTQGEGAWFIGGVYPDNIYAGLVSKLAFSLPVDWAVQHTAGRSLVVGDSFLSGGEIISHGPSLYAVAPWEHGRLPSRGEAVSAVEMLRYSAGSTVSNRMVNFRIDTFAKGAAWLTSGRRSAVAISYQRGLGDSWYGDSLGNNDAAYDIPLPILGDKGSGATRWKTALMFYNPRDLAEVCAGTMQPWAPQPYVVYDLDRFSLKPEGGNGQAGGIAYDSSNGRLFFIEHNGDAEDTAALIHVWRLRETGFLPVLQTRWIAGVLTLVWDTANDGSTHRVQITDSLASPGQWTAIGPVFAGDGTVKSYPISLSPSASRQFYRVLVERSP